VLRPRSVLLWKAFLWTCFTALLRPLAGMSWFEASERAGNYGIPLAFLVLATSMGLIHNWWNGFEVVDAPTSKLTEQAIRKIKWILQISLGLLLVGHGGLVAITQKQMYADHLALLGVESSPALLQAIGFGEILLGIAVALRPTRSLVWFILVWKLFTEALYPFAGHAVDVFETIERWGDYGGCIALLLILHYRRTRAEVARA
jgi:hypothetical protein